MGQGSHHQRIYAGEMDIGYIRVRNDGIVLSVYIKTEVQRMLFIPESKELVD